MSVVPSIIGNEHIQDFARSVAFDITTLAPHGFSESDVGKLVYMSGSTWTLADSSSEASYATHIIESVTGASKLRLCAEGSVNIASSYKHGTVLYVGNGGALTTTVTGQKFGFAESRTMVFMRLQNINLDSNTTYAKGDLITHNGSTTQILPVGSDGQFLVSDNTESTGLKWTTLANTIEAGQTFTQGSFGAGSVFNITPAPVLNSVFSANISVYEEVAAAGASTDNPWHISTRDFESYNLGTNGKLMFSTLTGSAVVTRTTGTFAAYFIGHMIVAKDAYGNDAGKALIVSILSSTQANVVIQEPLQNALITNYIITGVNIGATIKLAGPPHDTSAQYTVVVSKDSAAIDITNWTALTSFTVADDAAGESLFHAIGLIYANGDEKFIITNGATTRTIMQRLSGGNYRYNSNATYGLETFTVPPEDTRLSALRSAFLNSTNEMTSATLNAASAPSLPVINGAPSATRLLFASMLITTDSAVTPEITSINFTYNSNTKWRKNNTFKVNVLSSSLVQIESQPEDATKNITVYITD